MTPTEFETTLEQVKKRILARPASELISLSSSEFEVIVAQTLSEVLERKIDYAEGSFRFPDIVVESYGLEVKLTKGDSWTSTGNSILESTRVRKVEKIYLIFLKKGGDVDIAIRPYDECCAEIVVTHSPRYLIDMALSKDKTIFTKMNTNYDKFRQGAPIREAKKYYQNIISKDKERLWWLDEEKGEAVRPILRNYASLDQHEKDEFRIELMVLFPEIFGNSPKKFEQSSLYLLTQHNIICKSFRDIFTAGGQVRITVKDKKLIAPRIIGKCLDSAENIRKFLATVDEDLLKECWNISEHYVLTDRLSTWGSLVEKHRGLINGVSFTEIFDTGLIL